MEGELKRNFHVFCWCMKLAWDMSKKALIGWITVCSLVALLPMLSLLWQKDIISTISEYLLTGTGSCCRCNRSNFSVRSNSCIDWLIKPNQYKIYVFCSL